MKIKDDIRDWETITNFYAEGDGYGPYLVEVMIGEGEDGCWYGRTTDDAGGSDDAPDEPIATSEEDARKWAEEFAEEMDEYPDEEAMASEIADFDWWATKMGEEEILAIADAAFNRQSGSRLWVSNRGETHWDTGNTLRVEGWDDYVVIGASHDSRAAALNSLREAIDGESCE